MPPDHGPNVYAFGIPRGAGAPERGGAEDGDTAGSRVEEMYAVLSCLEYLYGEAVRLQARMSAHLIGAAAESLRRQIAETPRTE